MLCVVIDDIGGRCCSLILDSLFQFLKNYYLQPMLGREVHQHLS